MKKILSLLFIILSLFLISCEEEKPILVEDINVTYKSTMYVGEKQTIIVTITPDNATNKEVEIELLSDNAILTNNVLEAKSEGTILIKVSSKDEANIYKEINISAIEKKNESNDEVLVSDIEIKIEKTKLLESEQVAIEFLVKPENATNKNVKIDISDKDVISYNDGIITALKEGSSIITVSSSDKGNVVKSITVEVEKDTIIPTIDMDEDMTEFITALGNEIFEDLPQTYKDYNVSYVFDSIISNSGKLERSEGDEKLTGKVVFEKDGATAEKEVTLTVVGKVFDEILALFKQDIPSVIDKSSIFQFKYDLYGGSRVIVKSTSNPDVLTKDGSFSRPFHDEEVELTLNVRTTTPKTSHETKYTVIVKGQTIEYKAKLVMEWVFSQFPKNSIMYFDSPTLPDYCDEYDANIKWIDSNNETLDFSKIAQDPILGDAQVLTAIIKCRGEETRLTADYLVWNKKYNNKTEMIEDFSKVLYYENVAVYKYKSAAYYETNWGYLPFYFPGESEINKEHMLEYTYGRVRTGIKKTSTEYIVIHDTAGGAPTHTAESFAINQEQANAKENNDYISWHFTVGEDGIYQSLPLDETAYHAGDGSHVYGDVYFNKTYQINCIGGGNKNGIGIESCINSGADYNVTLRKLAKLVSELLLEFDLSFDRIKQHWHFMGKDCPGVIRHTGRWEEFKNLVKIEYFGKTQLDGVEFSYNSLTPDLLDNTGKVIYQGKDTKVLKYEITIKYAPENFEKKYSYVSNLLKYEDWSDR